MPHGPLICQDCFTEAEIETTYGHSNTESTSRTGLVCPNCGSESFAI